MSKVTVDIPDKLLDDSAKEEIAKLERKVRSLEAKVSKLEKEKNKSQSYVESARGLLSYIKDSGIISIADPYWYEDDF